MGKYTWMIKAFLFGTNFTAKRRIISGFLGSKKYLKIPEGETHTNMKDLLKCALCPNMCKFECPTLRATRKEMYAPATKSRISYFIERGVLDPSDPHTAEVPYICTNCDGCKNWCPMGISTGELLKGVRADLVERGCVSDELKAFNTRVLENRTTFTKETFSSHPEYDVQMADPEVFYYMGCVMAEKKPEAVMANISILKKAGVRFCTYSNERQCCGGPSFTVGFRETTRELGENNLELLEKAGAPTVITDCPACKDTIQKKYVDLGLKHKLTVMTTTEYYKLLIDEGRIQPTKKVDLSITYHDPCIAARGFGDIDTARSILAKIPGLELREPFLNKKETQCCGMGGVSHVHHPEISEAIGSQRYDQLTNTGADKIVTSCPACEEGFMIASRGKTGKVMDIAEILEKSL